MDSDTPDWSPLEAAIGSELAGWFMWMYEIRLADGSRLHAYKHATTRQYLHLTPDVRAFDYRGDSSYGEVDLALAIVRAFTSASEPSPVGDICARCGRRSDPLACLPHDVPGDQAG